MQTHDGQFTGILILGPKLSGQPYTLEDNQLISTISNQMAVKLENIDLYNNILRAREDLESWLNSMSDCVMIVNSDHTIQFINEAAEERFGTEDGTMCWEKFNRNARCPDCPIPFYINGSRDSFEYERSINDKQYDVVITPMFDGDHNLSVIEVLRDITDKKIMGDEIIESRARIEALRRSEQLKTELLSMVSHEMRTPLTVIKGFTTTLLRSHIKRSAAEQRQYLTNINQATDRMSRMVSDLLDMLHLESGGFKLEKSTYQISEIIEPIQNNQSNIHVEHRLQVLIPDDLPPVQVVIAGFVAATRLRKH